MKFYASEEDAMSDYNLSQTDWSQDNNLHLDLSTNESNDVEEAWYEDDYSVSDFGDEPRGEDFEPEPPDCSLDGTSQYKSCEETVPQNSLGETNPLDEPWNEDNFGVELKFDGEEPAQQYISFSGHSQGPKSYIRWEQNMDNWFRSNQVPEAEKTTYAEETLTEDAFRHWEREDYMRIDFDEPAYSWEDMKKIMNVEFVKDAEANKQYYVKIDSNPKPRRWILATRSYQKAKPKKACCPEPKRVYPNNQEKKTATKQVVPSKDVQQVPKLKDEVQKKSSKYNNL
ncbi:unnamed protein product [Arabis nemorensis]|uniref:Uncharacterized protein n=1 Tax=Arabis nemorensis TaxID=586526 RepID=A0A565AU72_9BRAS|nr:unnamed protein product [Arabis nemorensis]